MLRFLKAFIPVLRRGLATNPNVTFLLGVYPNNVTFLGGNVTFLGVMLRFVFCKSLILK